MARRTAIGCALVLIGLAATAALAIVAIEPVRSAALTVALVPELLDQGPKLLSATVPEPTRRRIGYGAVRRDRLDLYLPTESAARAGAVSPDWPTVVLVLGVNQVALEHPAVVRTATALARAGFVVAVPEDGELAAGRIRPEAVQHLVEAIEAVAGQPEVDAGRVGLAGFSAGGSLALLAAADPRLADRLAWVNAFGAYADAATLLVDIASRSVVTDGREATWQPGELARRASLELILSGVADRTMRDRLRDAVEEAIVAGGPRPAFDPAVAATLTGDAVVAYRLLTAESRASAEAALADLTPDASGTLAALSPAAHASGLRVPVFLMQDVGDDAIPASHLAALVYAIPASSLRRATAFELFDHVQPDAGGLTTDQLPDLWDLFLHLQALLDLAA